MNLKNLTLTKEQVINQLYSIIEHFEDCYDTNIYLYDIEALNNAIKIIKGTKK